MAEPTPDDRPEVLHAQLQREQVVALFTDLQQSAEIRSVMVRRASGPSRPVDKAMSLQEAYQLLDDDLTKAIQIQYEFEGAIWCDTLMFVQDGIRIVRTTLPETRK